MILLCASMSANPSLMRLPDREHNFEYANYDDEEKQRSPDAVQQDVVELAAVLSRQRRADIRFAGSPAPPIYECWRHCRAPAA